MVAEHFILSAKRKARYDETQDDVALSVQEDVIATFPPKLRIGFMVEDDEPLQDQQARSL